MKKKPIIDCSNHIGQKLTKLCKAPNCWVHICPKCAKETHKGHEVTEYHLLSKEASNAEGRLIKIKKGDIMSIKRIMESLKIIKNQMEEVQSKREDEAKIVEINIVRRIHKVANENNKAFDRLSNSLIKLEESLEQSCKSQLQEVLKIPELADAVISKGTPDDLKTFFEMCREGSEANAEVLEYKKSADDMKKSIEEFTATDPLKFVFDFDDEIYETIEAIECDTKETNETPKSYMKHNTVDDNIKIKTPSHLKASTFTLKKRFKNENEKHSKKDLKMKMV